MAHLLIDFAAKPNMVHDHLAVMATAASDGSAKAAADVTTVAAKELGGWIPEGNGAGSTAVLTPAMCGDSILTYRDMGCLQLIWEEKTVIANDDLMFYNEFWLSLIGNWMYAISFYSPLVVLLLP